MDYEQLYKIEPLITNTAMSLCLEVDDIALPLEDNETVSREQVALAVLRIALLRTHLAELETLLLNLAN